MGQMMAAEIKPGQWLTVTVKSQPRAIASRKTMVRLFEQDPVVKKERARQKKTRPHHDQRRGGRIWIDKPGMLKVVEISPGASYKVFGSVQTMRDLKSIEKYVELKPV
jgi:hypothetical protein